MDTKKAYQEKMEAQIREWSAKMELLRAKADKTKAEAKIKYYEQIEELKEKQELAHLKLNELRGSKDEAWEELKAGFDKAWEELSEGFSRALSKFKEKM